MSYLKLTAVLKGGGIIMIQQVAEFLFTKAQSEKEKKKESIAMHGDYYRERGKSDGEYWENSNFEMGVDR